LFTKANETKVPGPAIVVEASEVAESAGTSQEQAEIGVEAVCAGSCAKPPVCPGPVF
jgi:hypothetical protein